MHSCKLAINNHILIFSHSSQHSLKICRMNWSNIQPKCKTVSMSLPKTLCEMCGPTVAPKAGTGWETQQTCILHPLKDPWSRCQGFTPSETLLTLTSTEVFIASEGSIFTQSEVAQCRFSIQQQHNRTCVSMTKSHRLTAWVYCVKSQKVKENIQCILMDEMYAAVLPGRYSVKGLKCNITH